MSSNSIKRILVALVGIPIILHVAYWGGWQLRIFVWIISLVSLWEFYTMAKFKAIAPRTILGFITYFIVYITIDNDFISLNTILFEILFSIPQIILFIFLVSLLIEVFQNKGSIYFNLGVTFFGAIFFGLTSATIFELQEMLAEGSKNLNFISILISIWVCDTFAYLIGIKFGKNKISAISPNKTWEGAIGGLVGAILIQIIFGYFINSNLLMQLFFGSIIGIFAQVGDFIESAFKRDADVKDSSKFLPGHGGVWDRFDSLFVVAPIIYLVLNLFSF